MTLASALAEIRNTALRIDNPGAEANPAGAHLFIFIIKPLHGRVVDSLFSTHLSTSNRIRRLLEPALSMGLGPWG